MLWPFRHFHPLRQVTRPAARARQLLWGVVLAMLLAPALGRMHQLLHGPQTLALGQTCAAHVNSAASNDAVGHWLLALFAGHDHADCQLHDQLNVWAGPNTVGALLLPAVFAQEPRPKTAGRAADAVSAAFFDPRAPPTAASAG